MSFGFLGIQMGFGLQIGNVSRIFQTLDADVDKLAIYWLAGPVTGLIVQPIIGYFSDRTWSPRWGRRRPYFFLGAVLAAISLLFMPNSPSLWIAVGMLWIMDSSFNIAMEPFRAFVGDNLPSEQRTMGFAMQSFFIGVGAVIASLLPYAFANWFGISNTAPEGVIPDSVKWSFYVGAAAFAVAVLYTVFRSKEYSPEELKAFTADEPAKEFEHQLEGPAAYAQNGRNQITSGSFVLFIGAVLSFMVHYFEASRDLYVLTVGLGIAGLLFILSGVLQKMGRYENGFVTIINDLQSMPPTMKQLAAVQFFSWFALFAMWIYTTSAVTEFIYGTTDATSQLYNDGADWVSVCFGVYNGVAALVAFGLPILAKATSRRMTHLICLVLGGLGLISIFFIKDPNMLALSMVGVGIAWASILSMPYAILTGSLPSEKMGYYMGVFNFFIVIPQMVAASVLGFLLTQFFDGASIYALILGGVAMILAGLLCLIVDDVDERAVRNAPD
jgi:maltose/moltooligosaccharide transporter